MWSILGSIAMVFDEMGKPEEALENFNKSLEIMIRVVGCNHLDVAKSKVCAKLSFEFLGVVCLYDGSCIGQYFKRPPGTRQAARSSDHAA